MGIEKKDPANFSPSVEIPAKVDSFRFWCQKVLPLVYDDSLSYYELLCKVVNYLNNTIADVNTLGTDVDNLNRAYNELQSYVNNYFSTLDVQEEINNKLDVMAQDGSLSALIQPLFDTYKTAIDNEVNQQNNKIGVLENRMNTFTSLPSGSTSGDAELIDIRVPASGFNNNQPYANAGDAVRGQINSLKKECINYTDLFKPNAIVDCNTLINGNVIMAVNANTQVSNAPFDDWKDGGTWYIQSNCDPNDTVGIITQSFYKPGVATARTATRTYTGENWTPWGISTPTVFVGKYHYGDVFDCNDVFNSNSIVAVNANTHVSNAPFDDWKDGGTWYIQSNCDPNDTLGIITQSFYKPGVATARTATRTYTGKNWTPWGISTPNQNTVIECGKGKKFTTLRSACEEAIKTPNTTVIIYPGNYDLAVEYADHISAQSGSGILLTNGIHLIFMAGSYVKAVFDGSSDWVGVNFEPFKAGGDFTLEGLNITAANCRYCVHDEHGGRGTYHSKYINCVMNYNNTRSGIGHYFVQCIGGGLAEHSYIEINGGKYTSTTTVPLPGKTIAESSQPISYHNGETATCDSKIFISNVMLTGTGYFRFSDYGSSTIKSQVIISNCKMGAETEHSFENAQFSNVNFEITEYNNVIKTD